MKEIDDGDGEMGDVSLVIIGYIKSLASQCPRLL